MYSYGSPHTAAQKQDDQHERTFSSYVRIQVVVLKTYLGRWTIGRSGERGSGISVLPARYDDDDIVDNIKPGRCMFSSSNFVGSLIFMRKNCVFHFCVFLCNFIMFLCLNHLFLLFFLFFVCFYMCYLLHSLWFFFIIFHFLFLEFCHLVTTFNSYLSCYYSSFLPL